MPSGRFPVVLMCYAVCLYFMLCLLSDNRNRKLGIFSMESHLYQSGQYIALCHSTIKHMVIALLLLQHCHQKLRSCESMKTLVFTVATSSRTFGVLCSQLRYFRVRISRRYSSEELIVDCMASGCMWIQLKHLFESVPKELGKQPLCHCVT